MRVILKDVVISYPKLFKQDDKGKHGAAFVLREGQEDQLKAYKKAALSVLVEKFGKDEAAKMVKNGKVTIAGGKGSSVRTDVGKYEELGAIAYINSRSPDKPSVVSIHPCPSGRKNAQGKPVPALIEDEKQIWAGNIVNASVTLYFREVDGNAGVWAALNGVQKIADGEKRLDNRVSAQDEFAVDEDAVAKLNELTDEESDEDDLSELL